MAQPAANTPSRVRLPAWGTEGKLDGTNYTLWRFKMKAILNAYELWDTAIGRDLKPVDVQDPNDPSVMIQPDAARVQAWSRRDADTLCQIVTSCKDSVLTLIQHVNTAAEAWSILKAQYETTNETRKQNLETQLANEKMSETESVEKFITRIKDLRDQMAAIGVSITSEELARKCIRILPPKFDSLATTLNTQIRVPPLTFEDFSSILQEEELRQKARQPQGEDSAFSANQKKGKSKDSGNSSSSTKDKKKKKLKCFYCKKAGHIQSECRKKAADEKNGVVKPSTQANKKESSNNAQAEVELWVAIEELCAKAVHSSGADDHWIIDSGATRHMTSHKDWYSSLQPVGDDIVVAVGNDAKCPAKGSHHEFVPPCQLPLCSHA